MASLAGYQVSQCIVDHALSLALRQGEQSALLRIEGSFRLGLNEEWEIDASSQRSALGPSLGLFGRTIESANVMPTGELELVMTDGAWLRVHKGREYEAWSLSLPNKTLIVSGIDGEVSVFREKRS